MVDLIRAARLIAFLGAAACARGRSEAPAAPAADSTGVPPTAEKPRVSTPPADPSGPPSWVAVDSAQRTVTLSLETTPGPPGASALINGYRNGEARLVVPLGWTVKWNWRNADSASRHSLVVMTQREKIPLEGGRPAFSNAMTREVTTGLPAGGTDQTTVQADEAGWYWLLCGVPNHALSGEWIELRVDPEAKTAGLIRKAPSKP
jgi:Sulfocyanin (SoxE) domain